MFIVAQHPNNSVIVYPTDIPYIQAVSVFNAAIKVILRGNQTSSLLTIVDDLVYNGAGSRYMMHTKEDTVMYVLNGTLQFYLDGYQFCAPAGTIVRIPRNVTQSQRNLGSKPIHLLLLFSPSGMETFLDAVSIIVTQQPINTTEIFQVAMGNGLLFFPEVEWQDLNCAFNDGAPFSFSFHLTFLIFLLYFLISFC